MQRGRELQKIEATVVKDGDEVEIRFHIGLDDFGFTLTRDNLERLLTTKGNIAARIELQ